jgi:predicted ATPase
MNAAHSPEFSELTPGSRLGPYEVLERIGAGGMGKVYRALDTRLGREVALKTVSVEAGSERDAILRFEQEARSASALNHPNIVTIYEFGNAADTHYIAMELLPGQTVREILSGGPIPFRRVIGIAAQIADALAKAHESGIVHRDLKPANLMVTPEGISKILDFGLAKLNPETSVSAETSTGVTTITSRTQIMGTVGYMSPEQANGSFIDFRSDQFSFAAVLYEMVTGTAAFHKKTFAETAAAILRDEPEQIASRNLPVPTPFLWILERCLAKDPQNRYASTRDLARDLAEVRDRLADAPARENETGFNNLPPQRTKFIGREREAAALRQLLERDDVWLVTLTGPGGIGKTRLAVQVACEMAEQFGDGVCFVPLAAISEPALITPTIAQTLGLHDVPTQTADDTLAKYLSGLRYPMLLLLDNFEHLVASAQVVSKCLANSPKLKIVVTSQAALHISGEQEFPVPPMAVPDPKSTASVEELSRLPAVALFTNRAQAVKHDFVLTKENAAAVAAICARLDGLPLAIELAAARVKLLSPPAMLSRLESSLNLLTGGARDLPTRQQTLRGTVDWSYSLLNPEEQTLFRRLSVFRGGCTLEAIEAVCDTKGDLGISVLDGVASMVDKSLVQQMDPDEGETRFAMLSTLREYALERLAESGDEHNTRRGHAAYYLVLAEEGDREASAHPEWLDRFEVEHDNFRVALDFLTKTHDADWGLRLGAALFRFWETREHLAEGRERLARLLKMEESMARPKLRARLLFAAAVLAGEQGDYTAGQILLEESLETCVEQHDERGVAVALNALAVNARDRGEVLHASMLFERCVAIWRDLDDQTDTARALSNLANTTKLRGDFERTSALYEEALSIFRKIGDLSGIAWTLNYQGDVARERNDLVRARSCYEQSLSAFGLLRDGWGIASALSDLAGLYADEGNNEEACRLYGESVRMYQSLDYKRGVARVLEYLAANAAARSIPLQALRLAGAAAAMRERIGASLPPAEKARLDRALDFARRGLDRTAGMNAWMEGWAMPMTEAVNEALIFGRGESGNDA